VRRCVLRAFAGGLLVLVPAFAQQDHDEGPETFESTLHLILRSSRENLRPLKTFRIEQRPSNDYWYEVTDSLPGAACRIFEHPRMVYQCTWTLAKPGGPADSAALVGEIVKAAPEQYEIVRKKGTISMEPKEIRRYPVMEIAGERAGKAGLVLRIYPVPRD